MDIQELQEVCRQVRRDIIIMTNKAGAGHPGGSLSATEALVALYFDVMKGIDPKDDKNPNRDRFVLSKGHAAPALYANAAISDARSLTISVSCTASCRGIRT